MKLVMERRASWILFLALFVTPGWAQERMGIVTAVDAGDRVQFRIPATTIGVILAQIDAPDPGEPWSAESWESLRELCLGKVATLMESGTAPDGSSIGKLSCAGVRADEAQVRRGLARVQPPFDELNSLLMSAQEQARRQRLGMWSTP